MSDRGVAAYLPVFPRKLLASLALRGNMYHRQDVAGLTLERCKLSESKAF